MRNVPNVTCARKHQYTLPLLLPFRECAALFVYLVRASDKRDVLHALGGAVSPHTPSSVESRGLELEPARYGFERP